MHLHIQCKRIQKMGKNFSSYIEDIVDVCKMIGRTMVKAAWMATIGAGLTWKTKPPYNTYRIPMHLKK